MDSYTRRTRFTSKPKKDFSSGVFWLLLLSGFVVLGACIVVPAWLNCQQLAAQQLRLSGQLAQLRMSNEQHAEAIEAARHDAAFNERLLIEELNYHRPGEQALLVSPEMKPVPATSANNHVFRKAPAWLQAFAQRDTRNILLVMSTGLVLFAFVYYRPTKRSDRPSSIPVCPTSARFVNPT